MLRFGQMTPKKKLITTIAIAGGAAIALAAIAMMTYPVSYQTIVNAFSSAFEGVSRAFAMLSENVRNAVASAQSLLERQVM
jgi:poly-gamma-glutamate capsule biosynthesis protein CapA/YwtB (metallophosphatase superfamily)